MNLKDKKILVTGASSGIGRALAIACAQKGAVVIINYRKNLAGAEETLAEVKKYSTGFVLVADLTDEKAIAKMFDEMASTVGPIDILINNAGTPVARDFFDKAGWQEQFENIFFAALHTTQKFLKQNAAAPLRKILNITSYYGNAGAGNPEYFAYSAAKAALTNLTTTLAKIDSKILVNAVAPGYTLTPLWESTSEADKKTFTDQTMIKRFVAAEEIAQMAVAILENDALTGQVITVDGGLSLYV